MSTSPLLRLKRHLEREAQFQERCRPGTVSEIREALGALSKLQRDLRRARASEKKALKALKLLPLSRAIVARLIGEAL